MNHTSKLESTGNCNKHNDRVHFSGQAWDALERASQPGPDSGTSCLCERGIWVKSNQRPPRGVCKGGGGRRVDVMPSFPPPSHPATGPQAASQSSGPALQPRQVGSYWKPPPRSSLGCRAQVSGTEATSLSLFILKMEWQRWRCGPGCPRKQAGTRTGRRRQGQGMPASQVAKQVAGSATHLLRTG